MGAYKIFFEDDDDRWDAINLNLEISGSIPLIGDTVEYPCVSEAGEHYVRRGIVKRIFHQIKHINNENGFVTGESMVFVLLWR